MEGELGVSSRKGCNRVLRAPPSPRASLLMDGKCKLKAGRTVESHSDQAGGRPRKVPAQPHAGRLPRL